MCMRPCSVSPLSPGEHPSAGSRRVRAYGSDCHPARPPRFQERRSWWKGGDVTAMMALQLKNGDAAYYQSAEYCRNYSSAPVSYGGSSHYLNRLPGKETPPQTRTHLLPILMTPSGPHLRQQCAGKEERSHPRNSQMFHSGGGDVADESWLHGLCCYHHQRQRQQQQHHHVI